MSTLGLGNRQYLFEIVKALYKAYGDTLHEDASDVTMAKKVLKALLPYLCFHSIDISQAEFNKLRKDFLQKEFGLDE